MIRQEARLIAEAIAEIRDVVTGCQLDDDYNCPTCCVNGGRPERVADMIAHRIADKLEAIGRPNTAAIILGEE